MGVSEAVVSDSAVMALMAGAVALAGGCGEIGSGALCGAIFSAVGGESEECESSGDSGLNWESLSGSG